MKIRVTFSTILCLCDYLKRGHDDLEAQLLRVSKVHICRLAKIDKIEQFSIIGRKSLGFSIPNLISKNIIKIDPNISISALL